MIDSGTTTGSTVDAHYQYRIEDFWVGPESNNFRLHIDGISGNHM